MQEVEVGDAEIVFSGSENIVLDIIRRIKEDYDSEMTVAQQDSDAIQALKARRWRDDRLREIGIDPLSFVDEWYQDATGRIYKLGVDSF